MTSESVRKGGEDGEKYKCNLCNLCYSSEKDLTEHQWSLIHHSEMEKKSSTSLPHSCTLCQVTVPSIKEYRSHLNNEKHKKAVERSRSGEAPTDSATDAPKKSSQSGKKKKSKSSSSGKPHLINPRHSQHGTKFPTAFHLAPGFGGNHEYHPGGSGAGAFDRDFAVYNMHDRIPDCSSSSRFTGLPGNLTNGIAHSSWQEPPTLGRPSSNTSFYSMENDNWHNVDWGERAREWCHQNDQAQLSDNQDWGHGGRVGYQGNRVYREGYVDPYLPENLYWDFSRSYPGARVTEREREHNQTRKLSRWNHPSEDMVDIGQRKRQRDYDEEMSSSKSYKMADSSSDFHQSVRGSLFSRMIHNATGTGETPMGVDEPSSMRNVLSGSLDRNPGFPMSRLTSARSTESLDTTWSRGPNAKSLENSHLPKTKGSVGLREKPSSSTKKKSSALAIKQKYLGGKAGSKSSLQQTGSKSLSLLSPRDVSDASEETHGSSIVAEAARRVKSLRDQRLQANAQQRDKARKQVLTTDIDKQLEVLASTRQSRISGALEKGSCSTTSVEPESARSHSARRSKPPAAGPRVGLASSSGKPQAFSGLGSVLSNSEGGSHAKCLARSNSERTRNRQSDIERIRQSIENPDAPLGRRHSSENVLADSVESSEGSPQASRPLLPPQHRTSRNQLSKDLLMKMVNAPRSRRDQLHLALLKKQLGNQQTLPASRLSTLDDTEMVPDFTMGDLEIDESMDANPINCDDLPEDFQRQINQLLDGSGSRGHAGQGEGRSREAQPGSSCLPSQSQPRPDSALQLSDLASSLACPQSSPSLGTEPSSRNGVRNSSSSHSPQPAQPPALPDTATMDPDSAAGPSHSSFLLECGVGASPPHPSSTSTSTLGRPSPNYAGSSLRSASVSATSTLPQVPGMNLQGSYFPTETGSRPGASDFRVPSLGSHHLRASLHAFGSGYGDGVRTGAGGSGMPQQCSEAESTVTSILGSSSGEGSILEQVLAVSVQEEKLQAEVERAEARLRTLIEALQQTAAYHDRLVQSQRTLQKERLSLLRASDSQRSSQMSSSNTLDSRLQKQTQNVPESGRGAGSSFARATSSANHTSEDLSLEDLAPAGRDSRREETVQPSSPFPLQAPPRPPSPAPPPGPCHPLPLPDAGSGSRVDFVKREPGSPPQASSSPGLRSSVSNSLSSLTFVSSNHTATSVTAAPQVCSLVSSAQRRESGEHEVSSDGTRPQVISSRPYSVVFDHRSAGFSSPMAMLDSTATYIGSITQYDDIRGQLQAHLRKLPGGFSFDQSEVKREIQSMLHGNLPSHQQSLNTTGLRRQSSESTSVSAPTDCEGQGTESHQDRVTPRGSDCSLGERIRKMCQSAEEPIEVCHSDSDNTLVRDNSFEMDEAVSRSLRECSVILEKLPLISSLQSRVVNSSTRDTRKSEDAQDVKEEVGNSQFEQTTGIPMSPGQKRRLSRKERNRLSRLRKHELLPTTSEESSHDEAGRSASPRQRLQFQVRSPVTDSEEDVALEDIHTRLQPGTRCSVTSANHPPTDPIRLGSESPEPVDRKPGLAASTSSGNPAQDSSRESADESYIVQGTTPNCMESFVGPKARVASTLIHKDDLYVCYFGIQKPCRYHIEMSSTKVLYECGCLSMQCMVIVTQKGQEDRLFVGGDSRYLLAFSINSHTRVLELFFGGRITCLHADNDFLYAGLDTGFVEVMDLKTNKKTETFRCSDTALSSIQSGQEGGCRLLCVGSQSGTIAVVDAQNGLLVRELVGHTKTPLTIQVAKHQVYSGGMDKLVMVHNLHNGNLEKTYVSSQGVVKAVVVDKDMLYTGGFDGLVRCYKNGELVQMYYGAQMAGILTISIHKSKLYTGNSVGVVQSIPLKLSEKWACMCSNCEYVFGYREHLKFHIFRDHILLKARLMRCPWRECQVWITAADVPAVSIAQKVDEHITKHLDQCESG